jgi:asparagine synthase (glutamine-hydrolysing)
MCGIFGFQISLEAVRTTQNFLDHLKRRGPDSSGVYRILDLGTIGMTRLSINDLSVFGNQPMYSENGSIIVFNGEIYNFKELRNELIKLGAQFFSNSDTEVLLQSYLRWGNNFTKKLQGMYAFCIYDSEKKIFIVGRDPAGEKPLYLWKKELKWAFASDAKILHKLFNFDSNLSNQFIFEYLSFGYSVRGQTPFPNVRQIEPGEIIQIDQYGNIITLNTQSFASDLNSDFKFYSLSGEIELGRIIKRVTSQILDASDVDVGIFLSSGIDSGIIAKYALEMRPRTPLYNLSFDNPAYDEFELLHKKFKLHNDQLRIRKLGFESELILRSIDSLDTPISDSSVIPMFALSEFASKEVKVCLTGDGADELFIGYSTYIASQINQTSPIKFAKSLLQNRTLNWLDRGRGNVSNSEKFFRFFTNDNLDPSLAHLSWRRIFADHELLQLTGSAWKEEQEDFYNSLSSQKINGIRDLSNLDFQTWLSNNILIKSDRTSMANSLELRAPYLHPEVITFANNMPIGKHYSWFKGKKSLRELDKELFPIRYVRKKRGFSSEPILDGGIFDPAYVQRLIYSTEQMRPTQALKLYNLFVFSIWNRSLNAQHSYTVL